MSLLKDLAHRHPVSDADLSAYTDGRLDESRGAAVERHAATCERCRTALAELRAVKSMLSTLPEVRAPRSFTLSEQQAGIPAAPQRRAGPLWAPALALSVLVLLLAVDLTNNGSGVNGGAGNSLASKSVSTAEDRASSNAAAPATEFSGPRPAQTPAASLQPQAAGGARAEQATPAADGARQAQPTAAGPPQATTASPKGSGSGWSTLRLLEVAAALALLASVTYVLWYRWRPGAAFRNGGT